MTQDARSILAQADALITGWEHAKAVELLRSFDTAEFAPDERTRYDLLLGEALVQLGLLDHDYLDRVIEYVRGTADNVSYARAKLAKGTQLLGLGLVPEARETLLEAYAAYLRVKDHHNAASAQNRLAHSCVIHGDLERAIENLETCVRHYHECGETANADTVRGNLALTLWRCGRISESLKIYDVLKISLDNLWVQNRLTVLLGLSAVTALSGDLKTAQTMIVELEKATAPYPREHFIAFEYSGWIHLLAGKHKKASAALSKGLKLAMESAPASARVSQTKRLFGDLYVAMGKYDLAEKYAREGLAVAEKLTERLEIAACHRVFAQVEQVRCNDDRARHWYGQAIDMFSRIGARYELATTRLMAGSTGLYGGGDRVAMLHLAKEYFESENLTHLIAQVDRELARLAPAAPARRDMSGAPNIVTANPAMRKLLVFAEHIAASSATVLLTGETGTGKDLVARYIHCASGRKGKFVSINAAAIPATMIEAELFGHTKGSFSGAIGDRAGLMEQAEGGTFYLNEVADASPEFQAKLLDVLENRTLRRLGDNDSKTVDFRLIAATNHDIQARIRENSFRQDLFHRLNDIPIHLPPLRARPEDFAPLVAHFLAELGVTDRPADHTDILKLSAAISGREWPGNVRQLRAAVNHLYALGSGDLGHMTELAAAENTQDEYERLHQTLIATSWNRSRTAELLGVTEGTIRNKIRRFCLEDAEIAMEQ